MKKYLYIIAFKLIFITIICATDVSFTRDLRISEPRMNGEDITFLQNTLINLGFVSVGEVDGWYRPNTEAVIKKVELFFGFEQDGIVDARLWNSLFETQGIIENHIRDLLFGAISLINRIENNEFGALFTIHPLYHDEVNYEVFQMDGAIIKIIHHDQNESGLLDSTFYFFTEVIVLIEKYTSFNDHNINYSAYIDYVWNYEIREGEFIKKSWRLNEVLSDINKGVIENVFKENGIIPKKW